jgi:hypothetical protein
MPIFRINMMIDAERMMWKIDTDGVKNLVLKNEAIATNLDRDTGVLLVCREDWQKFKQFDHWNRKGLACYSVIVPYEKAVSDETSKEELTKICADLVVECLLFWAEKKQKRAAKTRTKAA